MAKPAHPTAVILAAGSGSRMADATGGVPKQYLSHAGVPLFWLSARTFSRVAALRGLVFVFPPADAERMRAEVERLNAEEDLGLPFSVVEGGARRQDSVRNGLAALDRKCDTVLVHDAARPFATASLITALLDALDGDADGAIPAVEVTDTVKRVEGATVSETLVRAELRAVQTPQAFHRHPLEEAHRRAVEEDWKVTDDASMVERLGTVVTVPGEIGNCKITTPEDLKRLEEPVAELSVTGWGYDVHRFGGERPLVLGGVAIPGGPGIHAHSDGDVLLHALADAILGTFGGGDIGSHFPDTDPNFDGANSGVLLKEVQLMAMKAGARIVHADLTVIAQTPKLAPHAKGIRRNVARLLGLDESFVNFKATTEEKLGFTGEKKGIKAVACVSAVRRLA